MEKYNWKDDPELSVWLGERYSPPKIPAKKFEAQYTFVIWPKKGATYLKKFVPEWALGIVSSMLEKDPLVKSFYYKKTYPVSLCE